jgi:hypothetical protein
VEIAFDDIEVWDLTEMELPTPVAQPIAPHESDPLTLIRAQEPLHSYDFDDESGPWEEIEDDFSVDSYVDGAYHLLVKQEGWIIYRNLLTEVTDFLLGVDATPAAGPTDNMHGLIFRYVDGDNYYFFGISSEGQYTLHKKTDGEWEIILPWSDSDAIVSETNRVGVISFGSEIVLLVNDEIVAEIEDENVAAGDVGVVVAAPGEVGVEIAFDNLTLWDLEGFEEFLFTEEERDRMP